MENRRSYLGLDLVRLCAAMMVAMYHVAFWWWLPAQGAGVDSAFRHQLRLPAHAFSGGWVGVQIFFVLSGFVIAFSASGKTAPTFLVGRAARLYPAAWICATLTLLVTFGWDRMPSYIRSLALIPIGPWISGVYWTLAVEIIFYALVALCLRIWGSRSLLPLGLTLGFYSSAFWALRILDSATGNHFRPFFLSVESQAGYLLLLHHGCDFALGIMIWKWAKDGIWKRLFLSGAVFLAAALIGVAGMSHAIVSEQSVDGYTPNWHIAPLLWLTAVGCILASVKWNGFLWRIIGRYSAQIRFIGLMTYPVYLLHSEIGHALILGLRGFGPFPALAITIPTILGLSGLVVSVEKYPRRMILRLFERRQPIGIPAADLP